MSLELIIDAIRSERCLPFLGAGASASYARDGAEVPGIPLGGRLGEIIAQACNYRNGSAYDLLSVAEYFVYRKNGRREELERLLAEQITRVTQPRPIHTALAQLHQVRFVITSNYDQFLEVEFQHYGRRLTKHVYDPTNPRTGHFDVRLFIKAPEVVLHKMHGTVEQPRSMVITTSDYIRYLAHLNDPDRGMPEFFRKYVIPQHTLLFLGYSLADWNFRVIWEGVLATHRDSGTQIESYAVVRKGEGKNKEETAKLEREFEFQRAFWAKRNVNLLDYDLTELARDLAREFNLEIPQLSIAKTQGGASA